MRKVLIPLGVVALAIEFALMTALALLAMATDHLFDGRKAAPKGPDRPGA